ncbi:MAG: hypothetical protein QOF45_508 [Gaiellaceae bacterium]|jgi:hypothetical protein|nr:hypothetical protein [Gaiellaceae bacterium]
MTGLRFVKMRTLLAMLALAAAAPAIAADLPEATGMAQRGSLKVVSRVLLSPSGGEMKGVWLDGKQTCLTKRALRVSIQIDLVSAGRTTRVTRARTGSVDNCAEGGPNFGFDLNPRAYKMACANGRWKPGRYSMSVKTTHVRSGLIAQASLYHQITRSC